MLKVCRSECVLHWGCAMLKMCCLEGAVWRVLCIESVETVLCMFICVYGRTWYVCDHKYLWIVSPVCLVSYASTVQVSA